MTNYIERIMNVRDRDIDEEALCRYAVRVFRAHWRKIAKPSVAQSMARDRAHRFLARSARSRRTLARRFYSVEHAAELVKLTNDEILELLSPWLDVAMHYLHTRWEPDPRAFLKKCLTTEYVLMFRDVIHPFPAGVSNDDIYEYCASGFSVGGYVRVFKSTGEEFRPSESRTVQAGMRSQLLEGADSWDETDEWLIDFDAEPFEEFAGVMWDPEPYSVGALIHQAMT